MGGILRKENFDKISFHKMAFTINQRSKFYPNWTMEKCSKTTKRDGEEGLFGKERDF